MFTILIQEKGGEQRRMVFNKPEVTIGRVQGNDIVLPKGNVSKRHARIVLKDGKFIIVDLKSTNGTYVNGRKITSPLVVKDSDKIYIGDFIVGVDEAAGADDGPSETTTTPPGSGGLSNLAENRPPPPTEAAPHARGGMGGSGLGGPGMGGGMDRPGMGGPGGGMDRPGMGGGMDRPGMGGGMGGGMDRPGMGGGMGGGMDRPGMGGGMDRPGMGGGMDRPGMGGGMDRPGMGGGMDRPGMGGPSSGLGGPMGGGMGAPEAPPASAGPSPGLPPPSRSPLGGPPRSPPGPSRDLSPQREPIAPPRDIPAPREIPPIGPPAGARSSGRPGGTMPPPVVPSPPVAAPAAVAEFPPPAAVAPPSIAPVPSQPAPVVPLKDGASSGAKGRGQPAAIAQAKPVRARPLSSVARRGVALEPLDPKIVKMLDLQSNILERLRAKLDLDKVPLDRLHEEDLWQKAERATIDLVETLETSGELPKYIDQDALIKETLNEALALGPLEDLFADEGIDEILIDRRDRLVVGKNGQLRGSGKAFSSEDVFERVVKRLVHEAGASIDEHNPIVDLRMRDGTRLTAAVGPVAARGACLVLKKPAAQSPTLQELVSQGALSSGMADFLGTCVTARRNILVCGGPASGKTALVGALATAAPAGERIVSVEDVAELAIARDEWVQLETRPATGRDGSIDMAALIETALRLMPDRLVVGEVRGREALTVIQALNANIDGAIVAMSGEGGGTTLGRLATLARASNPGGSDSALRELVATAFEIVVHVGRTADGALKVFSVEEVTGVSDVSFETEIVFTQKDGGFAPTGKVPRFYGELGALGINADQAVFR